MKKLFSLIVMMVFLLSSVSIVSASVWGDWGHNPFYGIGDVVDPVDPFEGNTCISLEYAYSDDCGDILDDCEDLDDNDDCEFLVEETGEYYDLCDICDEEEIVEPDCDGEMEDSIDRWEGYTCTNLENKDSHGYVVSDNFGTDDCEDQIELCYDEEYRCRFLIEETSEYMTINGLCDNIIVDPVPVCREVGNLCVADLEVDYAEIDELEVEEIYADYAEFEELEVDEADLESLHSENIYVNDLTIYDTFSFLGLNMFLDVDSFTVESLNILFDGEVEITQSLHMSQYGGTGYAFACFDSQGSLFRSEIACDLI